MKTTSLFIVLIIICMIFFLRKNNSESNEKILKNKIKFKDFQKIEILGKILLKADYPDFENFILSLYKNKIKTFQFKEDCYISPFINTTKKGCHTIEKYFLHKAYRDYSRIEMIDWIGLEDDN